MWKKISGFDETKQEKLEQLEKINQLEMELNQLKLKIKLATESDDPDNFHRNGWYYVTGRLFFDDNELIIKDKDDNVLVRRSLPKHKSLADGILINNVLVCWRVGLEEFK
jgi:hypothetical protein